MEKNLVTKSLLETDSMSSRMTSDSYQSLKTISETFSDTRLLNSVQIDPFLCSSPEIHSL